MKRHWIVLTVVALVITGAVAAAFLFSRPQGDRLMESIEIKATQEGELGIELETDFSLKSGYRITQKELKTMVEMDPPVEYTLAGGNKKWTISPAEPLEKNRIYTFKVKNLAGEVVRSFAFQTASDLLVSAVYPRNEQNYVGIDTGIEITFNAMNVNAKDYFEIMPPTKGTLEASGYTVIFKPDENLIEDSIYRVTFKKGLSAPNGMELTEDYSFSFETTGENSKWDYTKLQLTGDFAETFLPGDPLAVELSSGSDIEGTPFHIRVHRYPDIQDYIKEIKDYAAFYAGRYGLKMDYVADTANLEEISSFESPLLQKGAAYWGNIYALLPENMPEGYYIATISGTDRQGNKQFVQKAIQIRDLSVYIQSTDGDTLVWLNDPKTGEALSDKSVSLINTKNEQDVRRVLTRADGTARVMTGEMEKAYLAVLEGTQTVYFESVALSKTQEEIPLRESFYAAIYTDRQIYQPDDTIRFWGVIRPRSQTHTIPKTVTASLFRSWPENQIYSVKIPVNENGTYEGSLTISGMQKNWYSLRITDESKNVYIDTGLPIQAYTKPPYVITVTTNSPTYDANEKIQFQISAAYFDGTPVSGGKLRITSHDLGLEGSQKDIIQLDNKGKGAFTAMYHPDPRTNREQVSSLPSWAPQTVYYTLSNADPEDVYIYTSGSVIVLPSKIAAKVETKSPEGFTVHTAQVDRSKVAAKAGDAHPLIWPYPEFDRVRGASVDIPVTILIHKVTHTPVPTGSYYDYVNKKTITKYKYETVETIAKTIQTKTTGGTVTISDLPYRYEENVHYWIEVRFAGGVLGDVQESYYYYSRYAFRNPDGRVSYTFKDPNDNSQAAFALGEEIRLGLYANGIKTENKGRVLYTTVQRKMMDIGIFETNEQTIVMQEDRMPNLAIAGAYFDGRHVFKIPAYHVSYRYDSKKLKIDIKTDQEKYRPGDTAAVDVSVSDADGNPVSAQVCVGVVDEAVFALAPQEVNIAQQIYTDVFFPYIEQKSSYTEYELESANPDVGGMGGGGGDEGVLRTEFLDTALFWTVQTDPGGKAAVQLELPDNITSWRVTAVALTDDLKAGDNTLNTIVTLPFYVRPLFSSCYLAGDDISVSMNSAKSMARSDETVSYRISILDETGRELDSQTALAPVATQKPVNFGKYEEGLYRLKVSGKCGEYRDAVEYSFIVAKQGMTIPVIETLPLEQAARIKPVNYPVTFTIFAERAKPFMDALQRLSGQYGERTEVMVGAYQARVIYNEMLPRAERDPVPWDSRLEQIQDQESGVKILPTSQADAAVTAKMLIATPDLVNSYDARIFLESVLKNPAATADDRTMAYLGLAALGRPILLDLSRMAESSGLTVWQKLYLGAGLAKLGDFEGARKVYDSVKTEIITEGTLKYMQGATAEDRLQSTAAALMLTSLISHPDADALMRYFNELDTDRAKNEKVLFNLETVAYLKAFRVPGGKTGAKFSYDSDGKTQQVDLGPLGFKPIALSSEAMREANFKVLSGSVYACVRYTGYAQEQDIADNGKVKITKSYLPVEGTIKTASRIRVELKIEFDPDAPDGCYHISDYIPSGMRYLPSDQYGSIYGRYLWGSMRNDGQQMNGNLWRDTKQEEGEPIPFDRPWNSEDGDKNSCTIVYLVSASLPGEFIEESAIIMPVTREFAAKTPRGAIRIAP